MPTHEDVQITNVFSLSEFLLNRLVAPGAFCQRAVNFLHDAEIGHALIGDDPVDLELDSDLERETATDRREIARALEHAGSRLIEGDTRYIDLLSFINNSNFQGPVIVEEFASTYGDWHEDPSDKERQAQIELRDHFVGQAEAFSVVVPFIIKEIEASEK